VTLLLASILGITLGSYLYWVRTQNVLVAESQSWNSALALAEAGIEEGLAQVNVNFGQDPTAIGNYTSSAATNFGALGSISPGAYGPKTNSTLGTGSYSVTIQPAQNPNAGPTITAVGYTTLPFVGRPISRTVQITTSIKSLLANGITALTNVDLKGNGLTTDSYDSSDWLHFPPDGRWNSSNRLAGGDVASLYGVIGIQNANIYGHVMTGVNDTNAPNIGSNGRVGDLPANWSGSGIESGWWLQDFNMDVPDIQPPYGASAMPVAQNPNFPSTSTNTWILSSQQYYWSGDFAIKNNQTLYVSGNATLYVTGNFNMNNNSFLTIGSGASLKIYIGASSGTAVSGSFGVVNTSGNSSTFAIFGLPTLKTLTWNGNNSYLGTVYAPEASFNLGGGGSGDYDFQGAITVGSISMNGHFNLHYDQNLRRLAPASGFTVTSWREL
jgi:hypothetical protein